MKINPTTKANYYVPLNFGPQNHEKSKFCPPNLRVTTKKNEGCGFPKIYVTSGEKLLAPKNGSECSLARSRSRRESRSPGGGFSLRAGHSSAEGQFGDGKARGFRRPIPGGPGGISGSAWEGFVKCSAWAKGALGIFISIKA